MPDPAPTPEKTRRSRSFGSFLLVLLVLLVVLVVVGGDKLQPETPFTQDAFEWNLNTGRVITLAFEGTDSSTHVIKGTYRKEGTPIPARFRVAYSSIDDKEERFAALNGIREYSLIAPETLRALVEAGLASPFEARSLTAVRAPEPRKTPETRPGEAGAARVTDAQQEAPIAREQRLMVDALVRGKDAKERFPDLTIPALSGTYHFDVQLQPETDIAGLLASLEKAGAKVSHRTYDLSTGSDMSFAAGGSIWKDGTSPLTTLLFYVGPWILIFLVFMFFMRQMRSQGGAGGVLSFGRSRAQLYSKENHTNVTFDDVAGAEEAKAEVREIVEFLRNPSRFTRVGGRIPRGVLLVGSPGCGKTLLAKAIAGEAEAPFFSISGSDFVEMFVGVGASRVRDLFKQARDNSPCIIFLDEIDAVGRRRGSGMGGGHDEREQTLNAILVEMDGFGTDDGIIVVAATNRPDVLDPALLRPGRFDREVTIDLPDLEGRRAILEVHIKKVKAEEGLDMGVIARSTPGYSGADLAAIINEAAIMAVLDKRDAVSMQDLEEARDKVRYGRQKKSRKVEEQDRRITAIHEAGHAIVAAVLPETDSPHKITIVPRGRALGATMVIPEKESYHMQKRKLLAQLSMLFGGRIAEEIFCGDISAGASDDIRRATDLARTMVAELGMSEAIGPINYAERQGSDFLGTELGRGKMHSEQTAREIDEEVGRVVREAYERAKEILRAREREVEALTQALLTYETVTGAEVEKLLAGADVADLRPAAATASDPNAAGTTHHTEHEVDPGEGGSAPGELPPNPGLSPA